MSESTQKKSGGFLDKLKGLVAEEVPDRPTRQTPVPAAPSAARSMPAEHHDFASGSAPGAPGVVGADPAALAKLEARLHYGNGTDNIIRARDCEDWVLHFTAGIEWHRPAQAREFLSEKLPDVLEWFRDKLVDIVLYQAGADSHIDDPYGGWLTTAELRERDAMVFDYLSARDIPVAWNLAGGYQVEKDGSIPKVLEIHDNTMRECVRAFGS